VVSAFKAILIHRNRVIFEGGQVDEIDIFLQVQLQAWSWARFEKIGFHIIFAKWCLYPINCLKEVKSLRLNEHSSSHCIQSHIRSCFLIFYNSYFQKKEHVKVDMEGVL